MTSHPPDPPAAGAGSPVAPKRTPGMGDFFWMGTACALSVVIAGGAGYALDSWLGTTPWLTFVGLAFGITSAVLLTVSNVRKFI